jgi:hypothetical protein
MGKISDLFYKLTRGKDAPKPNDFGPAKVLKAKCGCGKECGCNSIESLERSAGIVKKVDIKIVPATVDGTATSIPKTRVVNADPKTSPVPVVAKLNEKAKATPKKKPVAKTTEKKEAIAKDLADTPAPAVKKPVAKKPTPKKK